MAALRGDIDAYEQAVHSANQEASRLRAALQGRPPTDMEALEREEAGAADALRALEDERLRLGVRIESNRTLTASVARRAREFARLGEAYAMVKACPTPPTANPSGTTRAGRAWKCTYCPRCSTR